MGAFISKQPNGLFCRFSSILDCPTHWNMTEDEYINNVTGTVRNKEEAFNILVNHLKPFSEVIDRFVPNNMTEVEFKDVVREMKSEFAN
ncbi:hypothetical protein [Lysinibacillus sphaericus]|uniref:hypothetical protein n=1 Tax=Lysinibacillus sphaericus TaxID=1421 RepID=UPI00056D8898|nr:hypothetical protein [Lysinibacillus sphaericus]